MTKVAMAVGQAGFIGGWKTSHPTTATITADGAVPSIPPNDMPTSMALIGAGDVMYISNSPACLSQLNLLAIDHRTLPHKESMIPPRIANPMRAVAPTLEQSRLMPIMENNGKPTVTTTHSGSPYILIV